MRNRTTAHLDPAQSAMPSFREWLDAGGPYKPQRNTSKKSSKRAKWADVHSESVCALCGGDVFSAIEGAPGCSTVDHIIPKSRGGTDKRSNLQRAHASCNQKKSSKLERQDLERVIHGALRATVNDHGPVVMGSWIGSAAKRIAGQIISNAVPERAS